jgi:hypothetical protein
MRKFNKNDLSLHFFQKQHVRAILNKSVKGVFCKNDKSERDSDFLLLKNLLQNENSDNFVPKLSRNLYVWSAEFGQIMTYEFWRSDFTFYFIIFFVVTLLPQC